MQAYVFPDHWKNHADKFVEGGVYVISNFYTKEATGSLKPVSSRFIINFSPTTTVDRVDDDVMISYHKFEFVDLSDLYALAQANGDTEFAEFSIGMFVFGIFFKKKFWTDVCHICFFICRCNWSC